MTTDSPPSSSSSMTLVQQGAEAKVYKTNFLQNTTATPCLLKVRFKKGYRHSTLDQRLTKHRCISEARLLYRCRGLGVSCPALYFVDEVRGEIYMEWIEGESVRQALNKLISEGKGEDARPLMENIGAAIARLHEVDIVHGDLTTSNILLKGGGIDSEVVLIDFGLGSVSSSDEDKAVDLYVLERAFGSTHSEIMDLFNVILESYERTSSTTTTTSAGSARSVLKRLREVRLRGRKRSMVG